MTKQRIEKRFGGLAEKVGIAVLGGLALVSCREKNVESKNMAGSYVQEVVDENEFTILISDRTKPSFSTPSEFLLDGSGNNMAYVRYHGISKDEKKFILSSDSNTPFILAIGLRGGKEALDKIKPPLKPYNNYSTYPLDSEQITILNKNYSVVSIDPNKITLRKIQE